MVKTAVVAMIFLLAATLASCAGGEEADKTPPRISGVSASGITETSAAISWTTDESSTSQVEYGTTTSYGATTSLDTDLVTSHSVSLSGLTADTTYHYSVKSRDASGNETVSEDHTFATASVSPGESITINLSAQNIAFDKSTITVPAGASVTVVFDHKDAVRHNFAVYESSTATTPIFVGDIIRGPDMISYQFTAPTTPGTYFFRCDVHPTIMTGEFIVTST